MKIKSNYSGLEYKPQIAEHPIERLAFNFSFITKDNKHNLAKNSKTITKAIRLKLVDKIYQLSQKDIVELLSHDDKYNGLEKIPEEEVKISLHPDFVGIRYNDCEDDYWVFQLSKKGRVIGKKYKNIFYILSIDASFKQYDHE